MENKDKLDESLYSRQLYVLGKEAMKSMGNADILISCNGLSGLAIEIAKCIILGGVKSVTLHNEKNLSWRDLTGNYYVSEKHIGTNPVTECQRRLAELNPYVQVNSMSTPLTDISNMNTVVLVDHPLEYQEVVNEMARRSNIKFISCSTYGVMGQIFCDFGDAFTVNNIDGEEARTGIVAEIQYTDKGAVFTTGQNHGLTRHDSVIIYGHNIFKGKAYKIKSIKTSRQFVLESDITKGTEITVDVSFEQIKEKMVLNYKSLEESVKHPEFVHSDVYNPDKAPLLHKMFCAIDKYVVLYGNLPYMWDENSTQRILSILEEDKLNDQDKKTIAKLANVAYGQLAPMHSVIGSIVAQEIMKACTGKFTPLYQWFYFDAINIIPEIRPDHVEVDSRYSGQIAVMGVEFQKKLEDAKIFIVGAGAIGCEHLKNFALMGVGNMIVTDMDTIEKSNLNRQFLFRNTDIGKPKSVAGARETLLMNPTIKITAHQNKVCSDTNHVYNEEFFKGLTCVANALDNVQARLFVDSLCVSYGVPLLESGTLGSKGNTQTIMPHMTESYGSTQDPPEESIPVCTLKNFPYAIEHVVQWARDLFEGLFVQVPQTVIKYTKDPDYIKSLTPSELHSVVTDINKVKENLPTNYDDCIVYGYKLWHDLYRQQIATLLTTYPKDHKIEGVAFWSGTKKCPVLSEFDASNKVHLGFVRTCANLWAQVFNIKDIKDKEYVKNLVSKMTPIKLVETKEKISLTEEEEKKRLQDIVNSVDMKNLLENLPDVATLKKYTITALEFEKDDDSNFHIAFMSHAANMRAINYGIQTATKHQVKGIAGKIIPAIATTTALVSGLVALEFYKIVNKMKRIEDYRNYYVNLAISHFTYCEPAPVKMQKMGNISFSFWNNFTFKDITLQELLDFFKKSFNTDISSVCVGQTMLLSQFLSFSKRRERYQQKLTDIYRQISGCEPVSNPMNVTVIIDTNDETDENNNENNSIDIPTCKIYF